MQIPRSESYFYLIIFTVQTEENFKTVFHDREAMLSLKKWVVASSQIDGLRAELLWDDHLE